MKKLYCAYCGKSLEDGCLCLEKVGTEWTEMEKNINGQLGDLLLDLIENKEESYEKLLEFTNAIWTVRKRIGKDICSYNLLTAIKFSLDDKSYLQFPISIAGEKDITINFKERTVGVMNYEKGRFVLIKLNEGGMSEELYDFIYETCKTRKDVQLDLNKLEEKYEIEDDIDLSGV